MQPLPDPPRTTRSTFGRDLALLLGIPGLLFVALLWWLQPWRGYEVWESATIFDRVAGSWDWELAEDQCAHPHMITFSLDSSVMILTHAYPWIDSAGQEHAVTEYDIQQYNQYMIRVVVRGETRRTDSGEPVAQDLVLFSGDTYRWHDSHRPPTSGYTGLAVRCSDGKRVMRSD